MTALLKYRIKQRIEELVKIIASEKKPRRSSANCDVMRNVGLTN